MLLSAIFLFAPTTAQARSFGGGRSVHTSPRTGGGRSFHTTPRVKSPSTGRGKSYHAPKAKSPSTDSPSTSGGKSYAAPSTDPNHPSKAPGLFSGFGRAIVHGAGWSIGSNMGNSLWHTMFGFGGNQYIGANGQTHYQSGGHSGWIFIISIVLIAVIAYSLFRYYRNRRK